MHHNPQAVVQVRRMRSKAFTIERSVQQGCLLSLLLYVLASEPLLCRLRDVKASPALQGILFAAPLSAKVFAYADDITVFVSRFLDIKAMKKAVARYEQIAGAKINFDKSKGLQLGSWRGGDPLPGPLCWSDGLVRIYGVWFGPGLQLERNWSEVQAKVDAWVSIWLWRRLCLKGRAVVCIRLYFFCQGIIVWRFDPSPNYSGETDGRWSVDRSVVKVWVMGV